MKKKLTPMEKLTAGYEKFIKGKELKENSQENFNKAIKKAAKPKQRGSK
jgi:hypothetical protein